MNHPFIKMLRYEYKSNYMMWLFNLIIGVGLLTTLYFQLNAHLTIVPKVLFPIFILFLWTFTINSYQESTKNQSMQMYHLIPVSRNTKFLSKQFITLIAYPLVLIILTIISVEIISIFVIDTEAVDESRAFYPPKQYFLIFWIFGHSISTFFGILFKKNKILYAILVYFCFQSILGIFFTVFFTGGRNPHTLLSQNTASIEAGILLVAAFFYGLSYHLFSKRQL